MNCELFRAMQACHYNRVEVELFLILKHAPADHNNRPRLHYACFKSHMKLGKNARAQARAQ